MHVDIVCSLVVYTLATVAFYLLGAGVLHGMGVVPSARDMIPVLSNIYTQTLGPWALWLFYAGALVTLYGTIVANAAGQSRLLADMMRVLGRVPAPRLRAAPRLAARLRGGPHRGARRRSTCCWPRR